MPNTLVREGYLDSDRVSALSDFDDRVFFRVLLASDDAGRADGRMDKLRSALFPTRESVRSADIQSAVERLTAQDLLSSWSWEGKPVIQVMRWQRRSGVQYSKFPGPDGSFKVEWVKVETRDGEISFCSTSLPMGCGRVLKPPNNPSEGVSEKSAETKTKTKTKTEGAREPKSLNGQQQLGERYQALWLGLYPDAGRCVLNKEHYVMLAGIVEKITLDKAVKAVERYIADRSTYVVNARHPVELFVKRINQYNAGEPPPLSESPARKSIAASVTLGRT